MIVTCFKALVNLADQGLWPSVYEPFHVRSCDPKSRPTPSADTGPVLDAPYATSLDQGAQRLPVRNNHDASAVLIIRARSELT